jgi:hypothetical protein
MSARSWLSRQWKPVALGVVFGAVEAFAINKVSGHNPWWWWAVLVAAGTGVIGCGLWGLRRGAADPGAEVPQPAVSQGDNSVVQQDVRGSQQHLAGDGRNVSISADNNSIAAYKIKNLTWGGGGSDALGDGNPNRQ